MTYLRSDAHLIVERDELFVESAVRLLGGGRGGGRALDMDKWPIRWQYSSTLTNQMTVSWSEEHWPIRLQYPHHFVFWPIRLQYSSTFNQLCVTLANTDQSDDSIRAMAMCHIIDQWHDSISAYLYGDPLLPGLVAVHVDVPLQVELGREALATAES